MEPTEFTYDAFVSYATKDAAVVQRIVNRLKDEGLRIWLASRDLLPGDDVVREIQDALLQSHALIVVLSANGVGSEWIELELNTFIALDPSGRQRRLIPVIIDDWEVPGYLLRYKRVDLRTQSDEEFSFLVLACEAGLPKAAHSPADEAKAVGVSSKGPLPRHDSLGPSRVLGRHIHAVTSLALLGGDTQVLSGSEDGTMRIWPLRDGASSLALGGHEAGILSVAVSAKTGRILSASRDWTVRMWDPVAGLPLGVFRGHDDVVSALAVLPPGHSALSGSWDGTVQVWDICSGTAGLALHGHEGAVVAVATSADGERAFSGSVDRTIREWDTVTGECIKTFVGHKTTVWSIALTPDAKWMLSSSEDGSLKLWDLSVGKEVDTVRAHAGAVKCISLSGDGSRVASASLDRTVKVWDVRNLRCLRVAEHEGGVMSVATGGRSPEVLISACDCAVLKWKLGAT